MYLCCLKPRRFVSNLKTLLRNSLGLPKNLTITVYSLSLGVVLDDQYFSEIFLDYNKFNQFLCLWYRYEAVYASNQYHNSLHNHEITTPSSTVPKSTDEQSHMIPKTIESPSIVQNFIYYIVNTNICI